MDSTTITLFSEILKGAGRNSENGRKKGGIKAHTIIQEDIERRTSENHQAAAAERCLHPPDGETDGNRKGNDTKPVK